MDDCATPDRRCNQRKSGLTRRTIYDDHPELCAFLERAAFKAGADAKRLEIWWSIVIFLALTQDFSEG